MRAELSDDPLTRRKKMYGRGATTVFALASDPRLSYCLYVPEDFDENKSSAKLIVSVHGTLRTFWSYRDGLSQLARFKNCVVLAPLFPVGIFGDGNEDGYKQLIERDLRYDLALLAMIDEASKRLNATFGKFFLFGFSGGGQFVNRFMFLHPRSLLAASIGSPGSVTLIDRARDYWVGTRNMHSLFGIELDRAALRQVPVQLIVGGADTEQWEINYREGSANYMPGINDTGKTRLERLDSLRINLEEHGVRVHQHVVPGVAHDVGKVFPHVEKFFAEVLDDCRANCVET